jgi:hypothetical protein
MNRSTVIAMVQDLTEHKADQRLDFNNLFNLRLTKFCQEKPFWWAKKVFSFSTQTGVPTYDFAQFTGGAGVFDFESFIKITLWQNGLKYGELEPNFDIEDIMDAQQSAVNPSTWGMPGQYCIEPGSAVPIPPATTVPTLTTLRLMNCPDQVYQVSAAFHACPQLPDDDEDDAIPLVPAIYHHGLVAGLKMDVVAFLYGEKSNLYTVAAAEYQDSVMKAISRQDFSAEKKLQYIVHEEGVRSIVGNTSPGSYISDSDNIDGYQHQG